MSQHYVIPGVELQYDRTRLYKFRTTPILPHGKIVASTFHPCIRSLPNYLRPLAKELVTGDRS